MIDQSHIHMYICITLHGLHASMNTIYELLFVVAYVFDSNHSLLVSAEYFVAKTITLEE